MRFLFRSLFILINLVAVAALLCVYAGMYISPEKLWFLALPALAYPILILVNLFFVFFWFFRKHRYLLFISLISILIRVDLIFSFIQPSKSETIHNDSTQIRCMTYNVKNFGLYSWQNNLELRSKIFDIVRAEQPDILCFQEFYDSKIQNFVTLDSLLKFGKNKQFHVHYTKEFKYQFWGIAMFTKYPILDKGEIMFPNTSNCIIWADLKIGMRTIRVYNCHLESFRIIDKQLPNFHHLPKDEEEISKYGSILQRLKHGFIHRAQQADKFAAHIKDCDHPIIIMGDFNDTPWSYTYNTIINATSLRDSFKTAGSSFGGTYAGKLPNFRIDYILHDKSFKAYNYKIEKVKLSDHYPLMCSFEIKE